MVVSENKTQQNADNQSLDKIKFVPLFYPILKSSIEMKEDNLYHMQPDRLVSLADVLKNHLNVCAFNVTKDQEALSTEIKHVHIWKIKKFQKNKSFLLFSLILLLIC